MLSGALDEGAVRLPDGTWLVIRPRSAHDPRWGRSDVLRREDDATPLSHFAALDWAARCPSARDGSIEVRPLAPSVQT